ncbi:unnamed protein product, partial [Heterosigma akashiwo]
RPHTSFVLTIDKYADSFCCNLRGSCSGHCCFYFLPSPPRSNNNAVWRLFFCF